MVDQIKIGPYTTSHSIYNRYSVPDKATLYGFIDLALSQLPRSNDLLIFLGEVEAMNADKPLSAADARELSESTKISHDDSYLAQILNRIKQEAGKGTYCLTVENRHDLSSKLTPGVRKALEKLGYRVSNHSDPRDGDSWVNIYWSLPAEGSK